MDAMGFLIALAALVLALMALKKISRHETSIAQLKLQLGLAIDELARLRSAAPETSGAVPVAKPLAAQPEEAESETIPSPALEMTFVAEEVPEADALPEVAEESPASDNWLRTEPIPLPAESPPPPTPKRDMEQALASRWFVWIGGVAIAIGGLLFVKYAYDNNLIPPALQIVLGLLLGAALVAAGEFVRRKSAIAMQQDYVPAALSAGGIVTAFGSIYAAYALYELISPMLAFGGLAAVALGALALSRLQGPLIAALGLIGSYVTPALIPSEHPSAWGFFPYLLVILLASFVTLRGRNWWWLGYAAIAGASVWTFLWIAVRPFDVADTLPAGLFVHAMGLVAFFGISGPAILKDESGDWRRTASLTPALAVGLVGLAIESALLAILVQQAQHATLAMALFMAAMAGLAAIGWRKSGLDILAAAAAALALVILMTWQDVALHAFAMDENGLWSSVPGFAAPQFLRWMLGAAALGTVLGCLGVRMKPAPILWGGIGGASAFLFVFGAWGRVDALMSPSTWAIIAIVFALALLATAYLGRARHDGDAVASLAAGLLSVGAALLALFAADRLFDGVWLTLVIAVLALVFALLAGVMRLTLQASIAAALGSFVAIRLFVSRSLWLDDRSLPLGQHWLIYGYGMPAILFLVASRALKAAGYVKSAISLEGLSLGLVISLASLEIRVLIGGGVAADDPGLLEMSAHILTWLGAAYGLLHRQKLYSTFVAAWGARVLLAISAAAIVLLSLLALNPMVTRDMLQGGAIFNSLMLAYLAPAVLLWLIARNLAPLGLDRLRPFAETLAVALVAVYLSLELKRLYGGPFLRLEPRDELEAALHVMIWLGMAVLLVYRGSFLSAQAVLMAARGLAALAVLAIVFGGLVAFNPVVSGKMLIGNVAINSLLLSYLAPLPLLALLARKLDILNWKSLQPLVGVLSLVLVFAYVTLETKRVFQGPRMVWWSVGNAESYAYSAVWLGLALALFVAGLKLARQYIRYAGLGVMVLVVVKVFLLDMSSLEGLYRIASFIGLGLCLVGIGWLYQRFVQVHKGATP